MGAKVDIDELLKAFRGEFVTKDACFNKKENYPRLELCNERTKALDDKIEKIEIHLGNIDVKLNNHMTHIAADIATIKTQLKDDEEENEEVIYEDKLEFY